MKLQLLLETKRCYIYNLTGGAGKRNAILR